MLPFSSTDSHALGTGPQLHTFFRIPKIFFPIPKLLFLNVEFIDMVIVMLSLLVK